MQQERLAAVGQLSAGIAHDFNTLLTSISLYTQMSLHADELSPQLRTRLEVIGSQTDQAAHLVQQVLDFGRRAVLERRPLALAPFLDEIGDLLKHTLPENIHVTLACEPGEHTIDADSERVRQALVNLALNARDAMPQGGELHIRVSRTTERDEIKCVICGQTIAGSEWVKLTVTDTGTGIPPNVLPYIFEPFFTTRAPLGHGLGLAQVYGIVKQHQGHIDVRTRAGQGTTVALYWPALSAPQPEEGELQ
jgi:signal transduction histidine kinase